MEFYVRLSHLISFCLLYPSISSKCLPTIQLTNNYKSNEQNTLVNCAIICPNLHKTWLQWKTIDGTVIPASTSGLRTRFLSENTIQFIIPDSSDIIYDTMYACVEEFSGLQAWLQLCDTTIKDCVGQRDDPYHPLLKRDIRNTSDSTNDTEPVLTDADKTTAEKPSQKTTDTTDLNNAKPDASIITETPDLNNAKADASIITETPDLNNAKPDASITTETTDLKITIPDASITTETPDLKNTKPDASITTKTLDLKNANTDKFANKTTPEKPSITAGTTDLSITNTDLLNSETHTTSKVATTKENELKDSMESKSKSDITSDFDKMNASYVRTDLSGQYGNVVNKSSNLDALEPVAVNPIDKQPSLTTASVTMSTKGTDKVLSSTSIFHTTSTEDQPTVDAQSVKIPEVIENTNTLSSSNSVITTTADVSDKIIPPRTKKPLSLAEDASLVGNSVNLEGQTTTQTTMENKDITTSMLTVITTIHAVSSTESSNVPTSTRQVSVDNTDAADSITTDMGTSTTKQIPQTTSDETSETIKTASQSVHTTSDMTRTTITGGKGTAVTSDVQTTFKKPKTTTRTEDKGSNNKSEGTGNNDSKESMFGKYGLPMFIAASALALCLLIVVIYLCLRKKRRRKEVDFMTGGEKKTPKLKMLEVRKASLKGELKPVKTAPEDDDLQTYSLDYEKHVQEKIEEHRKLVRNKSLNSSLPAPEGSALAGVSSFKIARRPSAESGSKGSSRKSRSGSQSGPTSPVTPTSPEGKPLLPKEEEPIVFNFGKKPGEATAARRGSALDAVVGQRPNSGNPRKATKPKDEYFGSDV